MNSKEIIIKDLSIIREKINKDFFEEKELVIFYKYYYSFMVEISRDYNSRLESYKICVLILENLLRLRKNKSKSSIRLDLLNCLYYGYLNFNLVSNKVIISSYFVENYNLYEEILERDTIKIEELKEITSLKFEYKIYKKVMILEKEDQISGFLKLEEFNLNDKKVII
ncbi:hypothetical protein [Algibacter sp. 2305UL17-15]|uniref:hypothetical protein n=1 Tax=Algibacter sp. 2305UL17-15 TaxID=3231268 RepID=UPI00345B04BD